MTRARNFTDTIEMYNKKVLARRAELITKIKELVPAADEDELAEYAAAKGNSGLQDILAAAKLIESIC